MTTPFRIRRALFVVATTAACSTTFAQGLPLPDTAFISVNSASGGMTAYGGLWYNAINHSTGLGLAVPGGGNRHTVFAANLWIGAQDAAGIIYTAAETYRQGSLMEKSVWCGPYTSPHITPITQLGDPDYNHVWRMGRAAINAHIQNYQQPSYQVPADIAAWPARTVARLPNGGAPFVNVGGDPLLYEPELGDYPDIPGESALFTITNDAAGSKNPYTPAMGLEIHTMVYATPPPRCYRSD